MASERVRKSTVSVLGVLAVVASLLAALPSPASAATAPVIYLSSTVAGVIGGVTYDDEDILLYSQASDTWSLFFDGSDVLPTSADVDGLHINQNGTIEVSLQAPATVTGLGSVDDSDVLLFTPTSLGSTTAGTWSLVLDGSANGLTVSGEDVLSVTRDGTDRLAVSTLGTYNVPAIGGGTLSGRDEDLLAFDGAAWELWFDGSDVGLSQEELTAMSFDPASGDLFGAARTSFLVPGVAGDEDDIFRFTGTTGASTSGTYTLFFDGDLVGFEQQIDGLYVAFEDNELPVAVDDVLTVGEDDGPTAVAVLDNDSDPDVGDVLTVDSVGVATTGTAALSGGVVTYDPAGQFEALAAGQSATDSFTYTVADGNGGFATATVNVTINGADEVPNQQPVAVDDVLAVGEDDGPTVIAVLDNDSDPDVGDVLTVDSVGAATTGTSGLSGGVVTYDPAGQFEALEAGQSAADSFTYTISDGRGGTATATVNVTINGADEAVIPDNRIYLSSTVSGGVGSIVYADEDIISWDSATGTWELFFDGSDVLPGSADVDGFTLVDDTTIDLSFLTPITVPGLGSVDDSDIVRFSATSLGDTTAGTFTTVLDGSTVGLSTSNEDVDAVGLGPGGATVVSTLGNVNAPAASGSISALDDDAILLNGSAWEFLFDGSDVEFGGVEDLVGFAYDADSGDLFGASLGGFGVIGVTGDSDDVFRFTGTTGATTSGSFTLFFDGDAVGFDQQIDGLDVRFLAPSLPPVAVDDVLTVGEDDGPTAVAVLDNDSDPDVGDVVRVVSVDPATIGSSALAGTVVTYDPAGQFEALAAGQTATDSFTYTITDDRGGFATATVNVTINGADEVPNQQPVAVDDVLAVGEDDGPTVIAVLDNDSDPDVGDVLAVDSVGAATTGTSGLSGGVVTYDPAGQFEALEAGQSAADSFTYTISDGRGGTATATVNVTIDGADEPVVPDNLIYLSSTISGGVGSIVYADEDIIAWDSVSGLWTMVFDGSDVLPGSADVDGFSIVDDTTIDLSFLAPVTVPGLGSVDDSDIVRFSATSLGDTTSGTFTTVLDGSTVGLATNNEDIDAIGRGLGGETVVSTFGNANVPASSGSLAALDDDAILLNGSAWEFLFDGSDVEFGGVEDLVGLSIDPASGDLFGASLGGFGVIGVTGDSDDVFRFTGTTGAATAGTFTLFFDGDAAGFDQQIDGLDVRLLTPNQEPVAVDDVLTVGEDDGPTAVAVLDNDTDPDAGDVLRVDSVGAAATGTAALSGGVVTYDPAGQFEALAAGQTATDSFTYTMTDGRGGFATATVNVTINGADELPNMPPVAVDDVLVVDEDAGPTVVAVLDNDSDPDTGDVLTVTSVGAAATGTSGLSGGVVTYDPAGQFEALAAGQSATDSFTYTIDDGNGETATATVNVTINGADEGVESFYVSSNTSGTVAGISFTDEDILRYDSVTDTWSMFFDGSDVLPDVDVDAIHINDDGSIDMSFLADATVDGLGLVTDSDVVTFTGTTGPNTSGTFSLALTGSAVGLNSAAEDIKALSKVGTDYAISTIGTALVPGAGGNLSGADDDLIVLDGTNSVWSTLFDGSDVGLTVSAEDLRGASILANGNIYLNTLGNHDVGGVTGDDNDVLRFTGTTGPTTAGTFVKAWDGDAHGWTVNISALHVEP